VAVFVFLTIILSSSNPLRYFYIN